MDYEWQRYEDNGNIIGPILMDRTLKWRYMSGMRRQVWRYMMNAGYVGEPVFFFQAEDGIRDLTVTGVQTCALPISRAPTTGFRRSGSPCPSRARRTPLVCRSALNRASCRPRRRDSALSTTPGTVRS